MVFSVEEGNVIGSVSDATQLNGVEAMDRDGDILYICATLDNRLTTVDISSPTSPSVKGSHQDNTNLGDQKDIVKDGDFAYITSGGNDTRLTVVNVSDPANPSTEGSVVDSTNLDGAQELAKQGDHVYVAASNADALTVVDVSDPANPSVAGSVSDSTVLDSADGVDVDGDFAYVTAKIADALVVVNVSDPSNPSIEGSVSSSSELDRARGVQKHGGHAYIAARSVDAVTIVDVSDPSNPSISGSVSDSTALDGVRRLEKVGGVVYAVASLADAVTVVDVRDTASPQVLGSFSDSTNLDDVEDVSTAGGGPVFATSRASDQVTTLQLPYRGDNNLSESGTAGHFAGSFTRKTPVTGHAWDAYVWIDPDGTGESTFLVWGHDTEASLATGYGIGVRDDGGLATELVRFSTGTVNVIDSSTSTPPTGEWVRVKVTHATDGSLTASVGGISLSGTDSNLLDADGRYSNHGVGYWSPGGNGNNAVDSWDQFVPTVEDWESGDLSDWNGSTADFEVTQTSPVSQPLYSLKVTSDTTAAISSTTSDGTRKPSPGDVQEMLVWIDSDSVGVNGEISFFWASDITGGGFGNNYYRVELDDNDGGVSDNVFFLEKQVAGTTTTLVSENPGSIPNNQWLTIRVEHETDGSMTAQLIDQDGTVLHTITTTDSDHITSGEYDQENVAIRNTIRENRFDAWLLR